MACPGRGLPHSQSQGDGVLCCLAGFSALSLSVQCQLWTGEKELCPSPGSAKGHCPQQDTNSSPASKRCACSAPSQPVCCRALSSTPWVIGARKSPVSPQPPQGWHPNNGSNGKHRSTASHLRHRPVAAPSHTALLQSPPQPFPYHVLGLLFSPLTSKSGFFSLFPPCVRRGVSSPLRREPLKHFESRTVIQALAAPSTAPTNLTHDTTEQGTSKVSLTANPSARQWRDMAWGAASPSPTETSLADPYGIAAPRASFACSAGMLCGTELLSPGEIQRAAGGKQVHRRHPREVSSFSGSFPAQVSPPHSSWLCFALSSGRILRSARCRGSAEGWAKTLRNEQRALRKAVFLTSGREMREAVTASGSGNKLHWDQARSTDLAPSQRRK